jgi:hypothetical protein
MFLDVLHDTFAESIIAESCVAGLGASFQRQLVVGQIVHVRLVLVRVHVTFKIARLVITDEAMVGAQTVTWKSKIELKT